MAIDQDTLDYFEPIIEALTARIEALETSLPAPMSPDKVVQHWANGSVDTYTKE